LKILRRGFSSADFEILASSLMQHRAAWHSLAPVAPSSTAVEIAVVHRSESNHGPSSTNKCGRADTYPPWQLKEKKSLTFRITLFGHVSKPLAIKRSMICVRFQDRNLFILFKSIRRVFWCMFYIYIYILISRMFFILYSIWNYKQFYLEFC